MYVYIVNAFAFIYIDIYIYINANAFYFMLLTICTILLYFKYCAPVVFHLNRSFEQVQFSPGFNKFSPRTTIKLITA